MVQIGDESAPIQLAQFLGWPFPVLKYKCVFKNKIWGSDFIKQHAETYGLKLSKCL